MRIFLLILGITVALMVYFRLAPTDAALWHVAPEAGDHDLETIGSFTAVRKMTAPASEVLTALEQRALATPRTQLVAGTVEGGMITFRTRSLFWGFPDFTTAQIRDDRLIVHGRLRFGRSDLGVNKVRIDGWLESLGPLTTRL